MLYKDKANRSKTSDRHELGQSQLQQPQLQPNVSDMQNNQGMVDKARPEPPQKSRSVAGTQSTAPNLAEPSYKPAGKLLGIQRKLEKAYREGKTY